MTQYLEFTTAAPNATLWDTPPTGIESYPVTTDALRALCEGGWRPIETAPRDRTVVLVYGCSEDEWEEAHDKPRSPVRTAYPAYVSVQKSLWWIAGGILQQVKGATHWQPLPPPPTKEDSNRD